MGEVILTADPTDQPTFGPTSIPTENPTFGPTFGPTDSPTPAPTFEPTECEEVCLHDFEELETKVETLESENSKKDEAISDLLSLISDLSDRLTSLETLMSETQQDIETIGNVQSCQNTCHSSSIVDRRRTSLLDEEDKTQKILL